MNQLSCGMKTIIILFAFLAASTFSDAQTVIVKANDPSIRYDLIKPDHTFDKVMTFDLSGKLISEFINEDLIKVDSVTKTYSFIRSRQVPIGHIYNDTSVITSSGPVSYHESSIPQAYEVKAVFQRNAVEAQENRSGVVTKKNTTISEGYFDDNTIENMMGLIPFKQGIHYHLECYRFESKGEINPFEIDYMMDDYIADRSGVLSACEVLQFKHGFAAGCIWVEKKSRRTLKEILRYPDHYTVINPA